MNDWTNTATAGEYNLLQGWARFPVEKVVGRGLRWRGGGREDVALEYSWL